MCQAEEVETGTLELMPMAPTDLRRDSESGVYYLRRRIHRRPELLPRQDRGVLLPKNQRLSDCDRAASARRSQAECGVGKASPTLGANHARQQPHAVQRIEALTPEVINTICAHFEVASLAGDG